MNKNKNKINYLIENKNRSYLNDEGISIKHNDIIKYPIYFEKLIMRIIELSKSKNYYSIFSESPVNILVFSINDRKELRIALKNKGGVYILWCKTDGLFYVGSSKNFIRRFSDYFSNKLVKDSIFGKNYKVSRDLAKSIFMYGLNDFTVIIVNSIDTTKTTKYDLYRIEEFWMLLKPTFNIILNATPYIGQLFSVSDREKVSVKFFQSEVSEDGYIIPNSQKIIFGIKNLSKIGITSINNKHFNIEYNTLKGHLETNKIYCATPINYFIFTWNNMPDNFKVLDNCKINVNNNNKTGKIQKVAVYDYNTKQLISIEPNVKACLTKYNISQTHFKRIRKYGYEYNGKLFKNTI